MEDLLEIYDISESYEKQLDQLREEHLQKLRVILWGTAALSATAATIPNDLVDVPSASPQQTKKRVKRLSSLHESDEPNGALAEDVSPLHIKRSSSRARNSQLLATAMDTETDETTKPSPMPAPRTITAEEPPLPSPTRESVQNSAEHLLMPPPAVPKQPAADAVTDDQSFARPQRAAKLKSEKNLKEPKLNQKLRRPSNSDTQVKLEHEQRPSQVYAPDSSKASIASTTSSTSVRSDDSVLVVPGKAVSVVELNSEDEQTSRESGAKQSTGRQLRIKIKREKLSISTDEERHRRSQSDASQGILNPTQDVPKPMEAPIKNEHATDESTYASTILSSTTNTTSTTTTLSAKPNAKKSRKKKDAVPKPIKVERFSDVLSVPSPISSRTRKGSIGREQKQQQEEGGPRSGSIYEDAVDNLPVEGTETPPSRVSQVPAKVEAAAATAINETVTISRSNSGGAVIASSINNTVNYGAVAPSGDVTFNCPNAAQTTFQVAPGQTTFIMDSENSTEVGNKKFNSSAATEGTGDATFNVPAATAGSAAAAKQESRNTMESSRNTMETAKDTTQPRDDSLITEDESFEQQLASMKLPAPKTVIVPKATKIIKPMATSAKAAFRMPTRTNELFNPLVQSPVKKKVEAFENVANAVTAEQTRSGRPKRTKENMLPTPTQSSLITPVIGKLHLPALGRFLTPTQASNVTPSVMAQAKKAPNSASKAMPFPKATTATNLKSTNSTSSKTLTRENSADDFRKGLHQMAEERKKQREQKHLLAAQQREAKERERAERMAKLAKEREEKRIKKQLETEQKKRELEEIQRKLRQQEEAAEAAKQKAAKSKAIVEQERELLMHMKQKQQLQQQQNSASKNRMMPPPPKLSSKYTFEMLHEDDSTDEEGKTSYKRPPPPSWSQSHIRGEAILMQQHWPTSVIDSFFSVQPMTPDLKLIFPNIDARHLKRNSSVLWSTPPRYSELPKY